MGHVPLDISGTQKAIYEARAKVNRDNVALIGIVIVGNTLKLAGRVINLMSFLKWP